MNLKQVICSRLLILAAVVALATPTGAYAWDNQRHGFILGSGLGGGASLLNTTGAVPDDRIIKGVLNVSFCIGYAPSDRLQIYFSHDISMFDFQRIRELYQTYFQTMMSPDPPLNIFLLIITSAYLFVIPYGGSHALMGPGVTFYLAEEAPSFFFEGGGGVLLTYDPFVNDLRGGLGASLAAGYEFKSHFSVKCAVKWGYSPVPETEEDEEWGVLRVVSLALTLNVVGY